MTHKNLEIKANSQEKFIPKEKELDSFDRLFYFCAEHDYHHVLYPASWVKKKEREEIIKLEKQERNKKY